MKLNHVSTFSGKGQLVTCRVITDSILEGYRKEGSSEETTEVKQIVLDDFVTASSAYI
jgi:hypothetical protein